MQYNTWFDFDLRVQKIHCCGIQLQLKWIPIPDLDFGNLFLNLRTSTFQLLQIPFTSYTNKN